MLSDEMPLKLMRLIEANPKVSQRDVACEFGISLGKVNYCLGALVRKGWIKASRFKSSGTRWPTATYCRARHRAEGTPHRPLLQIKIREYETLRGEIEQLRRKWSRAWPSETTRSRGSCNEPFSRESRRAGARAAGRSAGWLVGDVPSMSTYEVVVGRKIRIAVIGCGRIAAITSRPSKRTTTIWSWSRFAIPIRTPCVLRRTNTTRPATRASQTTEERECGSGELCTPSGLHPQQCRSWRRAPAAT